MGMGAVIGIGIGAALCSALSVPAARQAMLGSVDQDWLNQELEFDRIDSTGTVSNKDGTVFKVWRLSGIAYESRSESWQQSLAQARAVGLSQIGQPGMQVRLFGVKRRKPFKTQADWPDPALQEIGDKEATLFASSYRLHWYLVLSTRELRLLIETSSKVSSLFSDYKPQALKAPDLEEPSELLSFLNFLITGSWQDDLYGGANNVSACLPAANLHFDREGILSAHTPIHNYQRILVIKAWPEQVSGRLIGSLMALQGDIEVCHVLLPQDPTKSITVLSAKKRQFQIGPLGNETLAGEYTAAIDLVTEGKTVLFESQFHIGVRAESLDALDQLTRQVSDILSRLRIIYTVETVGMPIIWFNRMPGRDQLLRPLKLFSEPVAALWPIHGSPTGQADSPWDTRPVRLFLTPSGQTYQFQFHHSAKPQSLGHFLVFAPSGSGKSSLILHLLSGLAKMDGVRSYIFDSKEGTRFMVEAMGGAYQNFESLSLNPLDVKKDTPETRQAIRRVLMSMLGDLPVDAAIDEELTRCIHQAFLLGPPERTLNAVFSSAFSRGAAKQALARWVTDEKGRIGPYGHVFNAPHDSLAGFIAQNYMVAINMNEALDDPLLGPAVVTHIGQSIGRSASQNTRGFAIFVDEAARLLENEGFRLTVQEMFREYRKLNGVVGLAFQDPAALHRSGIGEALIENTATLIFFPNPPGKKEHYEAFNLGEEELAFILGGSVSDSGGGRRVLVIKRDAATDMRESAILDIDLSPYGIAADGNGLKYYRSGPDAVRLMQNLQNERGDQWRAFL